MNEIMRETLRISEKKDIYGAIALQEKLSSFPAPYGNPSFNWVLGFDAAYVNTKEGEFSVSLCVIVEKDDDALFLRDYFYSVDKVFFPYIPGLFSFREGVGFIRCWERIPENYRKKIGLIVVDGHGIMHPRRMGLASHIGLMTGIPTIGCAKERFLGKYTPPENDIGDYSLVYIEEKPVGIVLRTRRNVKPVWVSPGHLVGIPYLSRIIMGLVKKYRIPFPLRMADILARKIKNSIY